MLPRPAAIISYTTSHKNSVAIYLLTNMQLAYLYLLYLQCKVVAFLACLMERLVVHNILVAGGRCLPCPARDTCNVELVQDLEKVYVANLTLYYGMLTIQSYSLARSLE